MDYVSLLLKLIALGVCVAGWYKAAEMEENGPSPFIWAGISAALYLATWLVLGWGWPGIILTQIGMGLAIALIRLVIDLRKPPQPR
jgi:hypothetical protein